MKKEYCKECFYYNESILRIGKDWKNDIPLFNVKVSKCNGNHKKEPLRKNITIPYIRLLRIDKVNRIRVKICYFHCSEIYKIKYCFERKDLEKLNKILEVIENE